MGLFKFVFLMSTVFVISGATYGDETYFKDETAEVMEFLQFHEIEKITSYCMVGKLNCRSMVFYKNKKTGERVRAFEDRFIVSTNKRSVASRCFYLEQGDGTFNSYAQDLYTNEVKITKVELENQGLSISFDNEGYPTRTLSFFIVGTNDTKVATLMYSSHWAQFKGEINAKFVVKP